MGVEASERQFWDINDQICTNVEELKDYKSVQGIWNCVDYDKFILNPRSYLQELFAQRGSMFPPLPTNVWETKILQALQVKHFERRSQQQPVSNIPCLNDTTTDKIKNGQVVTFRCIIQDCLGPEMCPSEISGPIPTIGDATAKTTLLQDISVSDLELCTSMDKRDNVSERELLIGITPPGESSWVSEKTSHVSAGLSADEKRMKMDVDDETGDLIALPNYMELFPELFKNVGEAKPVVCLLKVYDSHLKPNDLVEVAGIVEVDSTGNTHNKDADLVGEELSNFYPKFWKLPKVFVFSCLKLADGNPTIPIMEGKLFPLVSFSDIRVSECSQLLRELLSLGLGGDRYASAYAMIALASRIMNREDSGYGPIGKIVVNINGIPESSDIPETFKYILKSLVPRTLPLDLTIENVNAWKLTPRKNVQTNQLESGMLQMARGTHVLINETRLKEGAFDAAGAHNVAALSDVLQYQQVKYDYTYQFPQLPTDAPVIVLSDTPSVLPVDVKISVRPDTKMTFEERRTRIEQILAEKGTLLRAYLSIARSILNPSKPAFAEESLNEDFESFFRTRNQPDVFNSKMTAAQFSSFITSCRLWGLLNGESSITRSDLMFWKDLERIKDSRLSAAKPDDVE